MSFVWMTKRKVFLTPHIHCSAKYRLTESFRYASVWFLGGYCWKISVGQAWCWQCLPARFVRPFAWMKYDRQCFEVDPRCHPRMGRFRSFEIWLEQLHSPLGQSRLYHWICLVRCRCADARASLLLGEKTQGPSRGRCLFLWAAWLFPVRLMRTRIVP